MVSNVSFWICGTGILQPKFQHHPQESHSSGSHHAQAKRQAGHSQQKGQTKSSSLPTTESHPRISPGGENRESLQVAVREFMSEGISLPCNVKGITL